jgi:hypothetical protein
MRKALEFFSSSRQHLVSLVATRESSGREVRQDRVEWRAPLGLSVGRDLLETTVTPALQGRSVHQGRQVQKAIPAQAESGW